MTEFLQNNGMRDPSTEEDTSNNYENNMRSLDQYKVMIMIVLRFLPSFCRSDEYMAWLGNIEETQNYLCQSLKRLMHQEHYTNEEKGNSTVCDEGGPKCLGYVHFKCVDDICESYYLYNFINTVECLPIGITLSQVVRDNKEGVTDFIMIYANEMYSWMTGYIRKELVGCKFTDFNKEAKRDIIKRNLFMTNSMRQSNSFVITLNNQGKKGNLCQQLLGTKPIFDSNGTFAYVIGIHIDVTVDYGIFWSDKLMTNLLSKLPSRLSALELQQAYMEYTCE